MGVYIQTNGLNYLDFQYSFKLKNIFYISGSNKTMIQEATKKVFLTFLGTLTLQVGVEVRNNNKQIKFDFFNLMKANCSRPQINLGICFTLFYNAVIECICFGVIIQKRLKRLNALPYETVVDRFSLPF